MRAINPATEEFIAEYPNDSSESVERKLAAASRAYGSWRALSFEARAAPWRVAAVLLRERAERYAPLLTAEMGKPIGEARAEIAKCAWVCEYYADNAETFLSPEPAESDGSKQFVRFDPMGVILCIMPWNFPFWQLFRFAAPTMMAGNTALLKHADNVPGCAAAIVEIFRDAGFPEGTFDSLVIEVERVAPVIADRRIRGVALTGSERAGRAVAAEAGRGLKTSVLELGGSDPFIVLADADVDAAVSAALTSRMLNNGQSCIAAKRFIVEAPVYGAFVEKLQRAIETLKVGDPTDPSVQIGPLARADLVDNLHRQVTETIAQGGRCLLGGVLPEGSGHFYPPTLISGVDSTMTAFREETFGPVAAVSCVQNEEEALTLANDTDYGLGACVWTSAGRGEALAAKIDAGCVFINGFVKSDPRIPFGGTKLSGYGRELSRWGILEFVNIKTVWIA